MHLEKNYDVKSKNRLIIPFKGLKLGKHTFVFDIDDKFFADFAESEIIKGKVHIVVTLDKQSSMLQLEFVLDGTVFVACDRCLDDLDLHIEYNTNLFIKFDEQTEEQTEEILVLSYAEHELDISQYIYEYAHLSLPYKRVHPDKINGDSTCNKDMLKKLEEYLLPEKEQDTDPRWNNLKDLMNNN